MKMELPKFELVKGQGVGGEKEPLPFILPDGRGALLGFTSKHVANMYKEQSASDLADYEPAIVQPQQWTKKIKSDDSGCSLVRCEATEAGLKFFVAEASGVLKALLGWKPGSPAPQVEFTPQE